MVIRHQSVESTTSRFSIFSFGIDLPISLCDDLFSSGRVHSETTSDDQSHPATTSWERSASVSGARRTRNGSVVSIEQDSTLLDVDVQRKARLVDALKKEVKNIMEEAVSKRSIDLSSNYVNALCAAVEGCLLDGLKKRMLGLLGVRTTFALLQHTAKSFPPALGVLQKLAETPKDNPWVQWCWIREALHMRVLSSIVHHISTSTNIHRLYEAHALMVDRSKGGMVAALLLGPCAVSFKRMSHEEAAEELVRQASLVQRSNGVRPPLSITRQGSSIVSVSERSSVSKDYIYSLHHNFKSSLLYGKNNVCVADSHQDEPTKGYLSLHKQTHTGLLILKWTPNQLMHANSQPCSANRENEPQPYLFKQAISIDISQIIYIHLHQKDERSPSVLIFVNAEGVQSAPLQFPMGQHSLVFLSSLESGLAPCHRLEPPLWTSHGKEKILPKIRRKTSSQGPAQDYVFRIIRISGSDGQVVDTEKQSPPNSPMPTHCVSLPNSPNVITGEHVDSLVNYQIGEACQSMKQQILARAFFGWLSYVRHLRTVRSHLMYLVERKELQDRGKGPINESFWDQCRQEKTRELEDEFLQRVYWSGIEGESPKELRRRCWPYLIGLFSWDEEMEPKTTNFTEKYRQDVEKWRLWEAEVRRLDEEAFNSARERRVSVREASITSDVFEEENDSAFRPQSSQDEERLFHLFLTNLHRIEKDVERCDRNLIFFQNKENLESLRRIMCTYITRNLEEGYVQGMCDILAPLLVVFEDEALTLECFSLLMMRMRENFPQRNGMDENLSNLRSLIQVVDPQVFSIFTLSSDFTHLYFSYRWFLLDFKRELSYEGTHRVWETIWASGRTVSPHFQLFFALALVTNYREVIIDNNMDFTDLIKFFNEMAERHDTQRILEGARSHLTALQQLVLNLP
ncbi:unnamed protein product, partial [Mesorhabditis belari]|uniref:Rab-GAP TBC domain-containing protein n=1 Tax=Mesorhabditis belari TaxID=2138241 RepID=A0AAF3EBB5_9BILA